MRCMGYLPGRTHQAMNKDARVKLYLHEAKPCICSAWFLVHLPYLWTKERCVGVLELCMLLLVFFFIPAKGQWTTNTRERHKGLSCFFLFVVHIHALGKFTLRKSFSMEPKMLANNLFHYYFFRERHFGKENFFIVQHFF